MELTCIGGEPLKNPAAAEGNDPDPDGEDDKGVAERDSGGELWWLRTAICDEKTLAMFSVCMKGLEGVWKDIARHAAWDARRQERQVRVVEEKERRSVV